MERLKTDILTYVKGRTDKVCIVELLKIDEQFYLYETLEKRTQKNLKRSLLEVYDEFVEADENFESIIDKKLKAGFKFLQDGRVADIPGFFSLMASSNSLSVKPAAIIEPLEEHRRLLRI